jgi:diaminopimelate decarboxylase
MSNLTRLSPNTSITPVGYAVNTEHQPSIDGVLISDLVEGHGTPLYVLDGQTIRAMASAYQDPLRDLYPAEALPLYASKANLSVGLCRLMALLGMGLDVVSGGELHTAIRANFPMDRIFFNGNNKSQLEIELALTHNIGRITVDNFYELALIHHVATQQGWPQQGKRVNVLLRVTPGIDCHTHDYIKTGHIDSKFGFDLSHLDQAFDLLCGTYANTVCLKGLHAHVGSQIFEVTPYLDLITVMLDLYVDVQTRYPTLGILPDLNLGGGLGIAYTQADDPPDVRETLSKLLPALQQAALQRHYPLPRLMLEPGRSMVATSGVTLYTVGSIKCVPATATTPPKHYVAVDGGMGDNIRPALYQAMYTAAVANKLNHPIADPVLGQVTIAGKYCESGDILIKEAHLPSLEPGDTLIVFGTGAYNYSMASTYNRVPRPAMILIDQGKVIPLLRRETYDDLLAYDCNVSF